jgi:NitT/TauT family transport system permease protein
LLVRGFDLKPYFLVAPTDIWTQFTENWSNIWEAMVVSGTNAAYGLVFGAIAGVLMSFVLSRFKVLDEMVTPMSIAINAIPRSCWCRCSTTCGAAPARCPSG